MMAICNAKTVLRRCAAAQWIRRVPRDARGNSATAEREDEALEALQRELEADGVDVRLNVEPRHFEVIPSRVRVYLAKRTADGFDLFIATDRQPSTEDLGRDAVDVRVGWSKSMDYSQRTFQVFGRLAASIYGRWLSAFDDVLDAGGQGVHCKGLGQDVHARVEMAVPDHGVFSIARDEQHLEGTAVHASSIRKLPSVHSPGQAHVGDEQVGSGAIHRSKRVLLRILRFITPSTPRSRRRPHCGRRGVVPRG